MKKEEIITKQYTSNAKLAQLLSEYGIKKLFLTSCGNSIANGYSFVNNTKPLLYRNESLPKIMEDAEIDLGIHHFARSQNNNDEHVYEYLLNDVKQSEINKLCRLDATKKDTPVQGLSQNDWDKYYPLDIPNDISLSEIISKKGANLANIVIYNGATGSLLDNFTRGGVHKSVYAINRDVRFISAIFSYIQNVNRQTDAKTQIYLCGAPKLLNSPISSLFINSKLIKLAKEYANVTYIPPISRKILYYRHNKLPMPDTHYNEEEYLVFNNKIMNSIETNFLIVNSLLTMDKIALDLSLNVELGNISNEAACKKFDDILINEIILLKKQNQDIDNFLKSLKNYLCERFPHDFYYAGNKQVMKIIKDIKNK